ncbi:tetratricopeptide repeat protein [Geoalkalibacter sp.]|uniref:tetratricopeptide repeat protein n=1 Tax=Geoalkalibacter sp. TaxID=3041440 RepID=UPI00272E3260|nr:hypothetical protein [Geoalkalibacter sp.]
MTPLKTHIPLLLICALLTTACAPGRFGPFQINPQDESLFRAGLSRWEAGDTDPAEFHSLVQDYPDSPLTLAAAALRAGAEQTENLRNQSTQDQERLRRLEKQHAQASRELDACRAQVRELDAQAQQFKQILIDTEGR